jgi:hypothetical protein
MTNAIRSIETVPLRDSRGQPITAIMCAVDMADRSASTTFAVEVAEKVKLQRMISPPDTSHLLVTVVGDVDLEAFRSCWEQVVARDQALSFFMSNMRVADCVHGTAQGQQLGNISLLPAKPTKKP